MKYYEAYYSIITESAHEDVVRNCFDWHSMADCVPQFSPGPGVKRPLINPGNADRTSCDENLTLLLNKCFLECFGVNKEGITINIPGENTLRGLSAGSSNHRYR